MSVLGLSGPPPLPPPVVSEPDKSDRKVIFIVITMVIVFFVAVVGTIFGVSLHYTTKFGSIDRSHESLSWDTDMKQAISTTFETPAYGITLKLPGKWDSMQQTSVDICHLLRADHRFNILVRPVFPSFAPAETVATQIVARFQSQGWTLKTNESITVSGVGAQEIRLVTPTGTEVEELIVPRTPVVYFVALSGPASDTDSWQRLNEALPQSIKIE